MVETMRKALRVLQRDPDLSAAGGIDEMDLAPQGPPPSSSYPPKQSTSHRGGAPSYAGSSSGGGGYNPNVSLNFI